MIRGYCIKDKVPPSNTNDKNYAKIDKNKENGFLLPGGLFSRKPPRVASGPVKHPQKLLIIKVIVS
jgi:hypothetical protein